MLWIAATNLPWAQLPPAYGRGDTVGKHFRRMAHDGAWDRVAEALAHDPPGGVLRRHTMLLCRLARRAFRIRGDRLAPLARAHEHLRRLWPKPPEYMPRGDVLRYLRARGIFPWLKDAGLGLKDLATSLDAWRAAKVELRYLKKLWTLAGGKANGRVPGELRAVW